MAQLSDAATRLMGAFGSIQAAVSQRASTAETYAAIRDAYTSQGFPVPSLPMQAVNELRSYAAGIRNAAEAFDRAPDEWAIGSNMVAETPWTRDLEARDAAPGFQLRFLHTTTDKLGSTVSTWRSLVIPGALPSTKAAVLAAIDAAAASMAEEYGVGHVGVSDAQILAR